MVLIANIERMDDRLDAVENAMKSDAALKLRTIKRSYLRHFADHKKDELEKGVLTLISAGEGDYNQGMGMAARDGTQRMLIIGHLKAADNESLSVEIFELDMIEEVKDFVKNKVDGMDLILDSVHHSRQQEAPYGWFVVYLDAKPQRNGVY